VVFLKHEFYIYICGIFLPSQKVEAFIRAGAFIIMNTEDLPLNGFIFTQIALKMVNYGMIVEMHHIRDSNKW